MKQHVDGPVGQSKVFSKALFVKQGVVICSVVVLMSVFAVGLKNAQAASTIQADTGMAQSVIQQVFGPDAAAALNVARCESGLNPSAVNPSSGASGLFQIIASTWASTSQAARSPFDALANTLAAHEIFLRDGHSWREWTCQP